MPAPSSGAGDASATTGRPPPARDGGSGGGTDGPATPAARSDGEAPGDGEGPGGGPDIPDDVALSEEDLPADLFDAPPSAPPPTRRPAGRPPSEAPAADPPTPAAATPDLLGALLGGSSAAEQAPEALRDTVEAIEELFPGTLVAAAPREVPDAEEDAAPGAVPNGNGLLPERAEQDPDGDAPTEDPHR